jgi:hypothetical protein
MGGNPAHGVLHSGTCDDGTDIGGGAGGREDQPPEKPAGASAAGEKPLREERLFTRRLQKPERETARAALAL